MKCDEMDLPQGAKNAYATGLVRKLLTILLTWM